MWTENIYKQLLWNTFCDMVSDTPHEEVYGPMISQVQTGWAMLWIGRVLPDIVAVLIQQGARLWRSKHCKGRVYCWECCLQRSSMAQEATFRLIQNRAWAHSCTLCHSKLHKAHREPGVSWCDIIISGIWFRRKISAFSMFWLQNRQQTFSPSLCPW